MVSYLKLQRELKRPDELQRLGQHAVPWMERHRRLVVGVLLGIGVLGLIGSILMTVQNTREERSSEALGSVLAILERPVNGAPVEAAPIGGAKPPFPSVAKKDEEFVLQAEAFRVAQAGSKAATLIELPLAAAYLRLGKVSEAEAALTNYLARGPDDALLNQAALLLQGSGFEAQKKLAEAEKSYAKLANAAGPNFLTSLGAFREAVTLSALGNTAEARTKLLSIETNFPESSVLPAARQKLAELSQVTDGGT